MAVMTTSATLTPADRFTHLVEGLFSDVRTMATNPWFPLALSELATVKLIWRRLRRMSRRFATVMAQLRAGTLPQAATAPVADMPADADTPPHAATPADGAMLVTRDGVCLPAAGAPDRLAGASRPREPWRHFGWVIHAISWFVWNRHYELDEMLADPQTEPLVAAAPQLGSVLRPLCQMLAVRPPAWLRRPRRPRRVVEKFPPAPEWLVKEPGAIVHPDGTVWMRLGASTHWKPGYPETLEQMQRFDYPVRIWPR